LANLQELLDGKLLPLFDTVLRDSLRYAGEIRFDKEHPQHLTLLCVYCTILEQSQAEQVLIRNGQVTALPVLFRSIFEAYADLRALIRDPTYVKRMYATFLREKVRFLIHVRQSANNPFFASIRDGMNIEEEIRELERKLQEFREQGKHQLSTSDRFQAAGLEDEYQSMYWLLCLAGHNNMSALDDRHIEKLGEDYHVVLFKEAQPEELVRIVDSLLAVLIDSGDMVHKSLHSTAAGHFSVHKATMDKYRDALLGARKQSD
jgi:hypothetical protein